MTLSYRLPEESSKAVSLCDAMELPHSNLHQPKLQSHVQTTFGLLWYSTRARARSIEYQDMPINKLDLDSSRGELGLDAIRNVTSHHITSHHEYLYAYAYA
jgi:hypothetical protein